MAKLRIPEFTKTVQIALALILATIVIAAFVSIVRSVFFDNNSNSPVELDYGRTALLSSSPGRSVRMTVRGNIVGDEDFRSYHIDITPTSRTLSKINGYMSQPISVSKKANNIVAYEQFVNALDKANFMKGEEFVEDKNDIRGICATGYVYNFELFSYSTLEKNLWTSTCPGSKGSLQANLQQIYDLFVTQIPDNKKLIIDIWQ